MLLLHLSGDVREKQVSHALRLDLLHREERLTSPWAVLAYVGDRLELFANPMLDPAFRLKPWRVLVDLGNNREIEK